MNYSDRYCFHSHPRILRNLLIRIYTRAVWAVRKVHDPVVLQSSALHSQIRWGGAQWNPLHHENKTWHNFRIIRRQWNQLSLRYLIDQYETPLKYWRHLMNWRQHTRITTKLGIKHLHRADNAHVRHVHSQFAQCSNHDSSFSFVSIPQAVSRKLHRPKRRRHLCVSSYLTSVSSQCRRQLVQ